MSSASGDPMMRTRSIVLDDDEMPIEITVEMDTAVKDALYGRVGAGIPVLLGGGVWRVTLPVRVAADIVRWSGRLVAPEQTEATSEAYSCLTNVFNRFWDEGVDGYDPTN